MSEQWSSHTVAFAGISQPSCRVEDLLAYANVEIVFD